MKPATVTQLKYELKTKSTDELVQICLRLAKFKKENKELLSYLLFENDEESYVHDLSVEISEQLEEINTSHIYYTKKGLRKVLRFMNRFIRYSGNKESEVKLRSHFCEELLEMNLPFHRSAQLQNLYDRELVKIEKALSTLHEDLQYDYRSRLEDLVR